MSEGMAYIILRQQVKRAEHLVILELEGAGSLEVATEGDDTGRLGDLLGRSAGPEVFVRVMQRRQPRGTARAATMVMVIVIVVMMMVITTVAVVVVVVVMRRVSAHRRQLLVRRVEDTRHVGSDNVRASSEGEVEASDAKTCDGERCGEARSEMKGLPSKPIGLVAARGDQRRMPTTTTTTTTTRAVPRCCEEGE